ncbi:MAG: extracellular solute-binding protein, partial [Firmicutes bacterium]|nr:extracellular solute-binding protein [Bacillota bacterium]
MKSKLSTCLVLVLTAALLLGISACGTTPSSSPTPSANPTAAPSDSAPATSPSAAASPEASADTSALPDQPVTIKFLSNNTDRTAAAGIVEQQIMDAYTKLHPNVTFNLETLADVDAQTKMQAYTSAGTLPDLFVCWGTPSYFMPLIQADLVQPLNPADYASYGFNGGSFDNFTFNGQLYGLPRSQDIMIFYYNKALFDQVGAQVPKTLEDMLALAKTFNDAGIIPCAGDGKDMWPQALMYQDLCMKASGNQQILTDATINQKTTFSTDPSILKATDYLKSLIDNKFFQSSFLTSDYTASQALFTSGKAAMYYGGDWDESMAVNTDLPQDFRDNIGVFYTPPFADGPAKATDVIAWNGGGIAMAKNSDPAVKAYCMDFINYMMKPDNWAKMGWQ